jgi:cytoskeletal protein RodZ
MWILAGFFFGLILMLGLLIPYMILPWWRSTKTIQPTGEQPNGEPNGEPTGEQNGKQTKTTGEQTKTTGEQTKTNGQEKPGTSPTPSGLGKDPLLGDSPEPVLKDSTEPEAGSTTTETARSEPQGVPTEQPPVVTTTQQPAVSPTAPVTTQPVPTTPTQTGSTPVIPPITPGPSTGPGTPEVPPSPSSEDMVILPTGERMPKSVIAGFEMICNDKRMNASTYLSKNSSMFGLPSSQIMLESGIAYDPIRKDCVYPIQAYNPSSRQWSPKNMRINVGILQHFK